MQFPSILAIFGLVAAAQACKPGTFSCGNLNGAPGPDGSVQTCNSQGQWVFATQCGGPSCCLESNGGQNVVCTC